MGKEQDTTFYRFLSEVRAFLCKLIKDPIKAEPGKYLKDRNFNKTKLINNLIRRDVLERHEKILDSTNSEEKDAKYVVKYKVRKKDFERRIYKIYIQYFEKNEPEKVNESVFKNEEEMKKEILNGADGKTYKECGGIKECEGGAAAGGDGGGSLGGTSSFSVGGDTTRGDMGYDVPFGQVQRRSIYGSPKEKEKGKKVDPTKILGKTVTAEGKKPRRIYITEEQYNIIMEDGAVGATSTTGVGSMGNFTANGLVLKTSDGKEDPCAKAGKINVKMIMDK